MSNTVYVVVGCIVLLTVGIVVGIYQYPEDETKQLIAGNRAMILTFYGMWLWSTTNKGKR